MKEDDGMKNKRNWAYVYTPKNSKRRKVIRTTLFICCFPVILPLRIIGFLGECSYTLIDRFDDLSEVLSEIVIFKLLKRE